MLKYLLEKEFKQFARNSFLPRLAALMPVMMLLVLPWAADMTTKNVNLVVVDHDMSTFSQRLVNKAVASDYFILQENCTSYEQAIQLIEIGDADLILEIPLSFGKDLVKTGVGQVLISANTVNATKGLLGSSYLTEITSAFAGQLSAEKGVGVTVDVRTRQLEIIPRIMFNPSMDYRRYMVPAFMVMILTLICGFLPALNVVMEKEAGTIEQINVTPVGKFVFIVGKLIPYWIMGVVIITISIILAQVVYGIVPVGSYGAIYLGFVIYVVALAGFGIVVSNYSATMQQAMFLMFFFLIIFILLSGVFTPISSMPDWTRYITTVNPLRYFIDIIRSIYFKGSTVADLWPQYVALVGFGIVSNIWAILSYKKTA